VLVEIPLSSDVVEIGKSVFTFKPGVMGSPKRKLRATHIVSLPGKASLGNTFSSVPQTDTGALVLEYQGKRVRAVQGTRQQKLGVTFWRCPARARHIASQL
jgi:hypothetical protein